MLLVVSLLNSIWAPHLVLCGEFVRHKCKNARRGELVYYHLQKESWEKASAQSFTILQPTAILL